MCVCVCVETHTLPGVRLLCVFAHARIDLICGWQIDQVPRQGTYLEQANKTDAHHAVVKTQEALMMRRVSLVMKLERVRCCKREGRG